MLIVGNINYNAMNVTIEGISSYINLEVLWDCVQTWFTFVYLHNTICKHNENTLPKSTKYLFYVITVRNKKDATILIYLLLISSTSFGRCFRPSSGAYHCNYGFWYCPPMLLLAGVSYWAEMTSVSSTQYATPASSNIGGQYQKP